MSENSEEFEFIVEDIFTITGRGTIFSGKLRYGSISVGDSIACKTRTKEVQSRVIGLEEFGSKGLIETATAGSSVAVVCKSISHSSIADAWEGEGSEARVVDVKLIPGKKKKWWQF